ncbi:MAG: ABC transporter ATP-binding protein [Candidatus Omnitrophica bacterium]|nr:ABC transporter ATP-binding protein [Candidatus Omnitrophota bacterium]
MNNLRKLFHATRDLFQRYPGHTVRFLLGNILASCSQIVSIGSLYPIIYVILNKNVGNDKVGRLFNTVFAALHWEPNLLNYLLLFTGVSFVSTVVFIAVEVDQNRFLRRLEYDTRSELTAKVLGSAWSFLRTLNHGRFVNVVMRDVESYKLVVKYIFLALASFIQFGFFSGALFYLNVGFAGLSFLLMAGAYCFIVPVIKQANHLGHATTRAYARQNHFLISGAKGFKEIKAGALETYFMKSVRPIFENVADLYFRGMTLTAVQVRLGEFLGYLVIAILLFVSMTWLAMNVNVLFIALVVISRIVPMLRAGIQNVHIAYSNLPSMDRMLELSQECLPEQTRSRALAKPLEAIVWKDVGFSYDGRQWLFRHLDCVFRKGDFWVITGETGSGKSTVLDLLSGIVETTEGRVECDQIGLKEIQRASLQKRIAYLTQGAFIFEGTILENITWGHPVVDPVQLRDVIQRAQLDSVVADKSLDFPVTEGGSNLSGGQQQRIMIGRTLLKNCDFILMDEPSSALDEATANNLMTALLPLKGRVGLIMVTHRGEFARHADYVFAFSGQGVKITANSAAVGPG